MASAANEQAVLEAFVSSNDDLGFKEDGSGKVVAKSTGHEMPPRLSEVKGYLEGKKYKKMREMYAHDYTKYEPFIVKHTKNEKFLFCQLTQTTLPMDPEKVRKHTESKRYKELAKEHEEEAQRKEAKTLKKKALREKLKKASLAKKAAKGEKSVKGEDSEKRAAKKNKNLKRKKPETSGKAEAGKVNGEKKDEEPEMIVKDTKKKKVPPRAEKRLRKNQMSKEN